MFTGRGARFLHREILWFDLTIDSRATAARAGVRQVAVGKPGVCC